MKWEGNEYRMAKAAWLAFLEAHGHECDLDAVLEAIIQKSFEVGVQQGKPSSKNGGYDEFIPYQLG